MRAERVLQHLQNVVDDGKVGMVIINREDAAALMDRVNYLEGVTTALLRSRHEAKESQDVVLPFQTKPRD